MVPGNRLLSILRDAFTAGVTDTEMELGSGVPLFGGLAVPGNRLLRILRDAFAVGVIEAEHELSLGVILFSHSLSRC